MTSYKQNKRKTLLGYELTPRQDAIVNYLLPSVCACILYMLIIAIDISVIYRHYKDEDPIWASLTLFIMYFPLIGSYVVIVSNPDLWPEAEGFGQENFTWFLVKTSQHIFFPIWSMWRYAERIFWSIEAVRSKDEHLIHEALSNVDSPRSIELYVFLQAYLHSLPQILLQLHILMRHKSDIDKETKDAQILCIVYNLAKLSVTTTYYQRFKSQKLTGKYYPWDKNIKFRDKITLVEDTATKKPQSSSRHDDVAEHVPHPKVMERRRSSDFYLEPSTSNSDAERRITYTDFDDDGLVTTRTEIIKSVQNVEDKEARGLTQADTRHRNTLRETSIVDGPRRQVYIEPGFSINTEPDFNITRVVHIKGLLEDDLAGKLISFWWWFTFLLARMLAVSVFAYFFLKDTIWILITHFVIVVAFLVYDVKSDEVRRAKGIFFIFLGFVYLFCIIEFKVKFKKATLLYYGFFFLVFLENFVMCMIWYLNELESIENDFWFRYIFYIVIMSSIFSFSSMIFYFTVAKPEKVTVAQEIRN